MAPPPRPLLVACGVDVGSTNTKVVALDPTGRVVARSGRPTPRAAADDSIDGDQLVDTIEEMVLEICAGGVVAAAVAVVGIGEDGLLVGEGMRPLGRALAWFDTRREQVLRDLLPELGPAAGLPVATDSSRTVVGWRWAVRQPGADTAVAWVALADYPGVRWTGRAFLSDSLAARTAAWSTVERDWVVARVDAALGGTHLLPEVLDAGDPVGPWRSRRLSAAGALSPDALVVAGGHDHPLGGWAVHRAAGSAVLDSMGTAEVVVAQVLRTIAPPVPGIDLAPGIRQSGTTVLCVQELARNMRWAGADPDVGRALLEIVSGELEPDAALTCGGFVPGAPGGSPPRYGPGAPTGARSRASAVVGALAQLGGSAVDRVAAQVAEDVAVFAAGGWARSPGWIRVKELVTGRSVTVVPEPETSAVGAALLAAEARGWAPSASVALGLPLLGHQR